jgi:DNA-binding transcriptional MerR regulator
VSIYRDKATLNTFAKIAADEYLGKNKTSLNDTLKKIASEEHLTPNQVEYVVAESNKAVWQKLFSLDKTASYDFPLADCKEVLSQLQVSHTPAKVEGADLDYLSPPTSTKTASFDPFKALGIQEDAVVKTAAAKKEVKRQLQTRLEKLAAVKEEIEMKMMVARTEIERLELDFIKTARNMVTDCPFEERGSGMDKVAEFLRGCGRPEQGQLLMKKLAFILKKQGLIKESDLKAPEQYISSNLPARIINGRHSLYVTIKTLFDKVDHHSTLGNQYEIVDSSLPVIKEKIRAL